MCSCQNVFFKSVVLHTLHIWSVNTYLAVFCNHYNLACFFLNPITFEVFSHTMCLNTVNAITYRHFLQICYLF